jgi:copper(I)-binding protein
MRQVVGMSRFIGCTPLIAAASALLVLGSGASAHGYKKNGIQIVHPWIMETAAVGGSVYMKIANDASEPDRLISVTSPIADKADLEGSGQAAQPTGAGAGFVVPARGELILKSAGPHIALGGLTKPLHAYGMVPMSLVFERAGKVDIEVMVEEAE